MTKPRDSLPDEPPAIGLPSEPGAGDGLLASAAAYPPLKLERASGEPGTERELGMDRAGIDLAGSSVFIVCARTRSSREWRATLEAR